MKKPPIEIGKNDMDAAHNLDISSLGEYIFCTTLIVTPLPTPISSTGHKQHVEKGMFMASVARCCRARGG
jgi:hypothetical protein